MNTLAESLLQKTLELGATVAGIASMGDILGTPAHEDAPIRDAAGPEDAVLVIGLHHPASRPELDYYTGKGGTEGNRTLIRINKGLVSWLSDSHGIEARDLPYYAEHGGVYLKDAAVLAGLGTVGFGNLMMVPGYGPYVRFRGVHVRASLPPSPGVEYYPCEGCHRPCLNVCPEGALAEGSFDREACLRSMASEGAGNLVMDPTSDPGGTEVRFCRLCELVCPVGAR